ncbi:unnamed protein product [Pieris macdunnoughi]|uniref:Uncharacterized protein n=1 Tax=Pieris macdunnoughi TaxID=345717 RepID=A0A821VI45_9NEOP|nr:unnamed protein product [Pieris macdunnoughi]
MKSTFLLLFVSVSSALVLYNSGEESLLKTELMDTGFPANTNNMKSDELPWADERLFYGLLKFHKNNTTEQDLNTKNGPETKAVKSTEIKRSKSKKVTDNSYSARKWYLKKGKDSMYKILDKSIDDVEESQKSQST